MFPGQTKPQGHMEGYKFHLPLQIYCCYRCWIPSDWSREAWNMLSSGEQGGNWGSRLPLTSYKMIPEKSGGWHRSPIIILLCHTESPPPSSIAARSYAFSSASSSSSFRAHFLEINSFLLLFTSTRPGNLGANLKLLEPRACESVGLAVARGLSSSLRWKCKCTAQDAVTTAATANTHMTASRKPPALASQVVVPAPPPRAAIRSHLAMGFDPQTSEKALWNNGRRK